MRSSYRREDVTLLLKDITGLVDPQPASEREPLIQKGVHYSEMLPLEYRPTGPYMEAYQRALDLYADSTAEAVAFAAQRIYGEKGPGLILVSLARAGIPAGILIKHFMKETFDYDPPHYAISIIRGRGIDHNALQYILSRHEPHALQFIDGWTGKGAIARELASALAPYPGVSPNLAVLSDPANLTHLCGTHEDLLIPSSCLNATVSGLISRTFLREDVIGPGDFHGAAFYGELADEDVSYAFIQRIEEGFGPARNRLSQRAKSNAEITPGRSGLAEVEEIAQRFHIGDLNLIKPGIGEATRVLLRRVPWKLLIGQDRGQDPRLAHLLQLAREREVPVAVYPLTNYAACGLIKSMGDV